MKDVVVNLKQSRKFFIYVLHRRMIHINKKLNYDDNNYKRLCQEKEFDHQVLDKINQKSNTDKPDVYKLSVIDCIGLMSAVVGFDFAFVKHFKKLSIQHNFKKELLIEFHNNKTIINFGHLIRQAGVNYTAMNNSLAYLKHYNQWLKSILKSI